MKESFFRKVAILAGGTAAGQILLLVFSPLLTRLYSPEDFGVLSAYISLLAIFSVIISLKYELSIALPEKDEDALNLLALSLLLAIFLSIFFGILLYFSQFYFSDYLNLASLAPYLMLLPLSLAGAGIYEALASWAIRARELKIIAKTKINQSVGQIITQLSIPFFYSGPPGLLIGDIVGRSSGSLSLLYLVIKTNSDFLKKISLPRILRLAWKYKKFPLISSFSSLLNSFGLQIPLLMIINCYGTATGGFISLGQRVVGIPLNLISYAVSQVYFSEAAFLRRNNPSAIRELFLKTIKKLFLIIFFPVLLLIVAGPTIFSFIFGKTWVVAGEYARLLSVMFLTQFIISPVSQSLNIMERQDIQFIWDVSRFILVTGSIWLTYRTGAGAKTAVMVYGGTMALSYLLLGLLSISVLNSGDTRDSQSLR